jgi:hypothetical protein
LRRLTRRALDLTLATPPMTPASRTCCAGRPVLLWQRNSPASNLPLQTGLPNIAEQPIWRRRRRGWGRGRRRGRTRQAGPDNPGSGRSTGKAPWVRSSEQLLIAPCGLVAPKCATSRGRDAVVRGQICCSLLVVSGIVMPSGQLQTSCACAVLSEFQQHMLFPFSMARRMTRGGPKPRMAGPSPRALMPQMAGCTMTHRKTLVR